MRSTLFSALLGLLFVPTVLAQVGTIQGTVVDQTGTPVPGANVVFANTTFGTATNLDGGYEFTAPAGTYELVVSAIGYRTQRVAGVDITDGGTTTRDVVIDEDVLGLDDIVVTGFSQTERRNVTTSIGSVSRDVLQDTPVQTADAALQGRVAGVTVLRSSGTPGGGVSVRVRGATSISGSNEPLYVIDGVPITADDFGNLGAGNQGLNVLSTLDPADIQSMEVLKDAAAAAIYGTRGANGVVLITTRRGQSGQTTVELESSVGSVSFPNDYEALTGPEYIMLRNEGRVNQVPNAPPNFYGDPEDQTTTNYWDAITQTGLVQNYRGAISGGNSATQYRVSGGFTDEEGAVIASGFRRVTGLVNLNHRWAEKGTLQAKASYARSTQERITNDNNIYGILTNGLLAAPNVGIYTDSTEQNFNPLSGAFSNPIQEAQTLFDATQTQFDGTVGLAYEVADGLTARVDAGIVRFDLDEGRFAQSFTSQGGGSDGENVQSVTFNQRVQLRGTLNYNNLFQGVHNFAGVVGASIEDVDREELTNTGRIFASDDVFALSVAADTEATGFSTESGLERVFGSFEYGYDNRYLATATLSVDRSSRFGDDKQTGVFPAFSLGWNAQQESFLRDVSWLDLFKIRGSYGLTGNDDIGNFASRPLWVGGADYNGRPGFAPSQLGNADLGWEETQQASLGLDFGFLQGRVGGTIEVYEKNTNDALLLQPYTTVSGFTGQVGNVADINNRGIEFQLTTRNISSRNFSWSTTVNLGSNANEVTRIVDADGNGVGDPLPSGFASRLQEGEPLGAFYGYRWDGLFQSADEICTDRTGVTCLANGTAYQTGSTAPGDFRFRDLGRINPETGEFEAVPDGIINAADQEILGHGNPDLFGGVTNDFSLFGFEVSAFLQFSVGNETFNASRQFYLDPGQGFGTSREALDRWTPENTDTTIPRATVNDPNDNDRDSDYFMEDGSYLRLRTLTVAYNVPSTLTNRFAVRNLRLFFVGDNLWTTTEYSGLDPEVSTFDRSNTSFATDFFTYPQTRKFTFGARVTL
jgi:TonB-linked SusC/RagA family outer membrane protein